MRPRNASTCSPRSPPRRVTHTADRGDPTRSAILRISDKKTLQLIEELEKEESLWNSYLPDYPNIDERMCATAIIAEKLDIPNFRAEHVTQKFKNLRNSYCQELKKMGLNKDYQPKVFWFAALDKFLRPHLQKINQYTNQEKSDMDKCVIKTEEDSDDLIEIEEWAFDQSAYSDASCSTSRSKTASQQHPSQTKEQKNTRKMSTDSRDTVRICSESEISNQNPNNTFSKIQNTVFDIEEPQPKKFKNAEIQEDNSKKDYCDAFGTYIASLMRTLPKRQALRLQLKIVDMVVKVGTREVSDDESDS